MAKPFAAPISNYRGVGSGFNVKLDERMERELLAELSSMPGKIVEAKRSAVAKTMKTARTRISQTITAEANLKSSEVKDRIHVKREPTLASTSGVLVIRGSRIPLWKFDRSMADARGFFSQKGKYPGHGKRKKVDAGDGEKKSQALRKPRKGAGWKIYKSEPKKRFKGFIIARGTKTGQIHTMWRSPGVSGKKATAGADYRIAYGPSLPTIMDRKGLNAPTYNAIRDVLHKNLRSQVDRFLKRKKTNA